MEIPCLYDQPFISFYLSQEEPNRSCLLPLRGIILQQDAAVTETRKYGMPCFCYGKKIFCYLWTDKKTGHPYILFVDGKYLDHPLLEAGDRSRMKVFRVDPNTDLPLSFLQSLLQKALELYRLGIV